MCLGVCVVGVCERERDRERRRGRRKREIEGERERERDVPAKGVISLDRYFPGEHNDVHFLGVTSFCGTVGLGRTPYIRTYFILLVFRCYCTLFRFSK